MKNRKGLVFALCALTGVAAMACVDDGGDTGKNEIKLGSLGSMKQGDQTTLTAKYVANATLTVVSNDKDCVTVSESVNTGDENEAKIGVNAVGGNCEAKITVSAEGAESKDVTVKVQPASGPILMVFPTSIELKAGEQKNVQAKYSENGQDLQKNLTMTSDNEGCAIARPAGVETKADGTADITIVAVSADACTANITVTPSAGGAAKTVSVKVVADDEPIEIPDAQNPILTASETSMTISADLKDGSPLAYTYKDGDKPLADFKLTISSDNQTCAFFKSGSIKTNSDGQVIGNVIPMGSDCNAKITATPPKGEKVVVDVTVSSKQQISIKSLEVVANSKYDKMNRVAFDMLNVKCDDENGPLNDYKTFAKDVYMDGSAEKDGTPSVVHTFAAGEYDDYFTDIDLGATKSIFVYAAPNAEDLNTVVGIGCHNLSLNDDGKKVTVELTPIPTDIKGKYNVVSNFDLTSGFKRGAVNDDGKLTCNPVDDKKICVPKVETMKAGDWVAFVVDFTRDPTLTLIEFVWSNALERIRDISDASGYQSVIDTILSAKIIAVPMIKNYVDNFLKDQAWYKMFTSIASDVNDLATNMQLVGEFNVEAYDITTLSINKASEKFTGLEYQWTSTQSGNCLNTAYNNAKCRESMRLSSTNPALAASMEGTWTGFVYDPAKVSKGDSDLAINSHSLKFRWATILYRAVFGTILPKALDYQGSSSVTQEYYIKAMLEKVLFEPVLGAYRKFLVDNTLTDENINEQNTCENFIVALVDWIYSYDKEGNHKPVSGMNEFLKSAVKTIGGLLCNTIEVNGKDYGLNGVDGLIIEQLDKIEKATTNALMFAAKDCALWDGGKTEYQTMGKPDVSPIPTAYDIAKNGKNTLRCSWDITMAATQEDKEDVTLKGYFHATRKE